ncbi:hypothetical protein CEV31_2042 [Brucella thiophenivorans]|uniref:Uncharacterized protein n=1 Tax=Brucella thiophenivorans TaxID=571255 RepID=A0A256FVE2_9HYPH|nr:hypothetical protein CEV31_2042 [Brucella thiophenivorans]
MNNTRRVSVANTKTIAIVAGKLLLIIVREAAERIASRNHSRY